MFYLFSVTIVIKFVINFWWNRNLSCDILLVVYIWDNYIFIRLRLIYLSFRRICFTLDRSLWLTNFLIRLHNL